jgi:hypothetical protein
MVLLDAGYGNDSKLRAGITKRERTYAAGILPQTLVWKPGVRPGPPPKKGRRDTSETISVKDLALGLSSKKWRTIKWREGTKEGLSSRFARVRVDVASSHQRPKKPTKEWLLIEWPKREKEPTKYWLSTLPRDDPVHWRSCLRRRFCRCHPQHTRLKLTKTRRFRHSGSWPSLDDAWSGHHPTPSFDTISLRDDSLSPP